MDTLGATPLSKELEAVRLRDGESLHSLALKLGVSHSTLVLFRQGKRTAGQKLLRAIMANIPELKPSVIRYLGNGHDTD